MSALLDLYAAPEIWLLNMPDWQGLLITGIRIMIEIGLGGWVLAKTGRSPLWVLALLVPYLSLLALWVYACTAWPAQTAASASEPAKGEP